MRVLSENEMATVAGGLVPIDGGGDGGGYTAYSSSNPLLGRQDVQQLASQSNLNGLLTQNSIFVVNQQAANAAAGASAIVDHTIYVPPGMAVNYSDGNLVMQMAHELGHFEHPVDATPKDYVSEGVFVTAQLTGEGWAQIQTIQTGATLVPNQSIPQIPGTPALASEEVAAYYSGLSNGESMSNIAQDIGTIMANETLANGMNYSQWYSGKWDSAWSILS
jgi:hypothetical protein